MSAIHGQRLQHRSDVRSTGRISKHGCLKISSRQAMPNSQGEHVNDLVRMRAHQMGAHDEVGFIIDQDLVAVDRFRLLPGSKPGRVRSVCIRTFILFSLAWASVRPTAAMGGMVKATLGTPS